MLKAQLDAGLAVINFAGQNGVLRLFSAYSHPPGPGTVVGDLTEASYPGYSSISLYLTFGPSGKVIDGQYQALNPLVTFATSGAGPYPILGYYVDTFPGHTMLLLELFDVPFQLTPGNALTLQLQFNQWSRSVLP